MEFEEIYNKNNLNEIEILAHKGVNLFDDFLKTYAKRFNFDISLQETTINGTIYNKIDNIIEEILKINKSLQNHLNGTDSLNIKMLKNHIHFLNLGKPQIVWMLETVFKDSDFDNDDKETAHKYATIYDQLITRFESLLLVISARNIKFRTILNNNEIEKLEKLNMKNPKMSPEEIEEFITNIEERSKNERR
jgi:hypothetical protein